ncbi:MAG: STAS domain-containing protein [Leptospira sp.]|nr:STAS domain-containing protein [Leptospira sp.]
MLDLQTKEISSSERIYSIDLQGVLDTKSSHDFLNFLQNQIKNGYHKYIIRCDNLLYVTSAGIGCVLKIGKEFPEHGIQTVFIGVNEEIKSVLNFFGISKHILHADSMESALKILKASAKGKSVETPKPKEHHVAVGSVKEVQFSFDKKNGGEKEEQEDSLPKQETVPEKPADPDDSESPSISSRLTQKIREVKEERDDVRVVYPEKAEMVFEDDLQFKDEFEIVYDNSYVEENHDSKDRDFDIENNTTGQKSADAEISHAPREQNVSFMERIIVCESCGSRMRIIKPGKHQCPACKSIFTMRRSGSVSYLEKLI